MAVYAKFVVRKIKAANALLAALALGITQMLALTLPMLAFEIIRQRLAEVLECLLGGAFRDLVGPRELFALDGVERALEVADLDTGFPVHTRPIVDEPGGATCFLEI